MTELTHPHGEAPLRDALRRYTAARVGLRRAGAAVATSEQLAFQLDHALARDAVHAKLDVDAMLASVRQRGLEAVALRSAVGAGAEERKTYLRRPDLGRRLDVESAALVEAAPSDVVFVIADGLSALAVMRHALAVLDSTMALLPGWTAGPVCVVSQGRVAVGDEIGERLQARMTVVLIGERPGLSAADSLGAYLTWEPRVGRTDAERNCVSNIRPGGLSYADAARRIAMYLEGAKRLGATGVRLKDQAQLLSLSSDAQAGPDA